MMWPFSPFHPASNMMHFLNVEKSSWDDEMSCIIRKWNMLRLSLSSYHSKASGCPPLDLCNTYIPLFLIHSYSDFRSYPLQKAFLSDIVINILSCWLAW